MNLDWKSWALIIMFIIIVLLTIGTAIYYHKYKDAEQQIVIWNDSLTIYKNKYNEEYIAKNTYILKANQLEQYNKNLYDEYKKLKDNAIIITKTKIITRIDTIHTSTDSIWGDDNIIKFAWSANDSCWYEINGESWIKLDSIKTAGSTINDLSINSQITLDVVDDGNQLKIIAKSDNPYMCMSDLESVVIDPLNSPTIKKLVKPKRWGFGPFIGVGVYSGYDLGNKGISIGAGGMIGFGIHYDFFQW